METSFSLTLSALNRKRKITAPRFSSFPQNVTNKSKKQRSVQLSGWECKNLLKWKARAEQQDAPCCRAHSQLCERTRTCGVINPKHRHVIITNSSWSLAAADSQRRNQGSWLHLLSTGALYWEENIYAEILNYYTIYNNIINSHNLCHITLNKLSYLFVLLHII